VNALHKSIWTAAVGAALLSQAPAALADSLTNFSVQYYGIANQQGAAGNNGSVSETPDFYDSLAGAQYAGPTGLSNNFVTSTLGPNGLPVFNPGYSTVSGAVNPLSSASLLGSTNQINWWDPASSGGNANSTSFGTGAISLSSTATSMSVPGQIGDSNYFAADVLTGYFTTSVAGNVQFSVGADDSAFVYVDGTLVDSIGGLNADAPANTNTIALAAGSHTVKIFYADRETPGGNLTFSEVSGGGLLTPTISATVPEPSTIALFGFGVLALYGFTRRGRISLG
jgi:fibro-slime domain-containing protein